MSSNMLKSKPLRVLLKISEDRTPKRSGFLIRITQRLQSLDDLGEAPHLKTPLKCPSIFTCHTEDVFLAWLETCPQKQQCGGLPEIWRDLAEDLRGACSIMQHGRQGKSCGISNLWRKWSSGIQFWAEFTIINQKNMWDSVGRGTHLYEESKIIIPSWIPREKPSPPHVFELRFFVWAVWQHEGLNPCHGLHETELSSSTVFHWHWMAYNPKGMFELQRPSSSYRHLWYFLIHLSNNISVLMFIWVHHFGCSGTVPLSSNIGQLVVDLACYGWFDIPCSVSRPCRHNQLQKQSIQSAPLPRKPVAVSQGWNNKCSITKPHKRNRSRVLNHTKPY